MYAVFFTFPKCISKILHDFSMTLSFVFLWFMGPTFGRKGLGLLHIYKFSKFILLVSQYVNLWYDARSKDLKQFDLLKMALICHNQVTFEIGFHRNLCIVCVFWEIWKWWKDIHHIGWHQQDNRNKGKYNEQYH